MLKKSTCFVLALLLILTAVPVTAKAAAKDTTAAKIKLVKTKGTVKIERSTGSSLKARKGMRLVNGYTVVTSSKSYAYISLDADKAVKIDANSKIKIRKKGSKIELYVKSGKLFFNVSKPLKKTETMNIKTSTATMGIRGTSGMVSQSTGEDEFSSNIQLYDGKSEITMRDPATGKVKKDMIAGGESASITVDGNNNASLVIESLAGKEDKIPAFAALEIKENTALAKRIEKEGKLDVKEITTKAEEKLAQEEKQQTIKEEKRREEKEKDKNKNSQLFPDDKKESDKKEDQNSGGYTPSPSVKYPEKYKITPENNVVRINSKLSYLKDGEAYTYYAKKDKDLKNIKDILSSEGFTFVKEAEGLSIPSEAVSKKTPFQEGPFYVYTVDEKTQKFSVSEEAFTIASLLQGLSVINAEGEEEEELLDLSTGEIELRISLAKEADAATLHPEKIKSDMVKIKTAEFMEDKNYIRILIEPLISSPEIKTVDIAEGLICDKGGYGMESCTFMIRFYNEDCKDMIIYDIEPDTYINSDKPLSYQGGSMDFDYYGNKRGDLNSIEEIQSGDYFIFINTRNGLLIPNASYFKVPDGAYYIYVVDEKTGKFTTSEVPVNLDNTAPEVILAACRSDESFVDITEGSYLMDSDVKLALVFNEDMDKDSFKAKNGIWSDSIDFSGGPSLEGQRIITLNNDPLSSLSGMQTLKIRYDLITDKAGNTLKGADILNPWITFRFYYDASVNQGPKPYPVTSDIADINSDSCLPYLEGGRNYKYYARTDGGLKNISEVVSGAGFTFRNDNDGFKIPLNEEPIPDGDYYIYVVNEILQKFSVSVETVNVDYACAMAVFSANMFLEKHLLIR